MVARRADLALLCPGKYYTRTTKCPHTRGNETPVKGGGIVDKLCVRLESTGQLECKLDSCVLVYASYFVDMLLLCPTLAR